jgi:hypothetical protein
MGLVGKGGIGSTPALGVESVGFDIELPMPPKEVTE